MVDGCVLSGTFLQVYFLEFYIVPQENSQQQQAEQQCQQ